MTDLVNKYQEQKFAYQQWQTARKYVHDTLKKKGHALPDLIHPNSDYDIKIQAATGIKRIKIRAFRLVREKEVEAWRLTVEYRGGRAYDILIGVLMHGQYKQPECYIFTDGELNSLANYSNKQFKRIKKVIRFYPDKKDYKQAVRNKVCLREFEHYVNKHREEFLNKWNKIL